MTKQYVDKIAMITSALCAVHCALLPILISFGFFGGLVGEMHHTFEIIVFGISAILGAISIYNGVTGHGDILPQLFIGLGAAVIMIALILHVSHIWMAIGGMILMTGHWINWKKISIGA